MTTIKRLIRNKTNKTSPKLQNDTIVMRFYKSDDVLSNKQWNMSDLAMHFRYTKTVYQK